MVSSGRTVDFWSTGHMCYAACVFIANLVLLRKHHNITGYGEALLLACALSFFATVWLESFYPFFTVLYKLWDEFIASPSAWFGFFLACASLWTIDEMFF